VLFQDPFKIIKEVAQFLKLDRSDDEISEVVEATSFPKMKQKPDKIGLIRKGISMTN